MAAPTPRKKTPVINKATASKAKRPLTAAEKVARKKIRRAVVKQLAAEDHISLDGSPGPAQQVPSSNDESSSASGSLELIPHTPSSPATIKMAPPPTTSPTKSTKVLSSSSPTQLKKHVPTTSGSGNKGFSLTKQGKQHATSDFAKMNLQGGIFDECHGMAPPFNLVMITFDQEENLVFTPLPTFSQANWNHLPEFESAPLTREEVFFNSSTLQHLPQKDLVELLKNELVRLNSLEQDKE